MAYSYEGGASDDGATALYVGGASDVADSAIPASTILGGGTPIAGGGPW